MKMHQSALSAFASTAPALSSLFSASSQMSSKTPSVTKTSVPPKMPVGSKPSSTTKATTVGTTNTSASERASSFVNHRSTKPPANTSSSSSSEGGKSPTAARKRGADLDGESQELSQIDDLHVYAVGESMM